MEKMLKKNIISSYILMSFGQLKVFWQVLNIELTKWGHWESKSWPHHVKNIRKKVIEKECGMWDSNSCAFTKTWKKIMKNKTERCGVRTQNLSVKLEEDLKEK